MRWVWFIVVVACGGASSPSSSTSSSSSSASSSSETPSTSAGAIEPASPAQPEVVNLSAGPPVAEPALVPQRAHSDAINVMHIVRDRPLVITGTQSGGLVSVIDVPTGHVRAARRFFRGWVRGVDASADGTRVLVSGTRYAGPDNPRLIVWDLRVDSAIELKGMERQLSDSAISSDGERAAWITHEYEEPTRIHFASTRGGDEIVREVPEGIRRVTYAPDGSAVVAAGGDSVLVVDPATGETRATLALFGARDIVGSPNGRWYAVRGRDAVVVFDAQGRERARLGVRAMRAQFNPSGSTLVLCIDRALVVHSGADLSEKRETEVECGEWVAIDARWEPTAVSARAGTLTVRRDAADPDTEEMSWNYGEHTQAIPTSTRRRWLLVSSGQQLYIYNLRRQRLRRIVAEGVGESSAWSVGREGDVLRLKGRAWHRDFPRPADPQPARVEVPDGTWPHSTSPDGRSIVVVRDPLGAAQPTLIVEGSQPRRLSLPRSAEFGCYDYEDGSLCGSGPAVWGPGNQFVLPLDQGVVSYAPNGRRIGHSTTAESVRFADENTLLVEHEDGALTLATLRFQRRLRVFNARSGGEVRATLDDGTLAATRGRVLQVVDVASAAQRHRVELSAPATDDPTFIGDQVQLRTREGFFRWSLADGSETMRVEIDDVRSLSNDQSEVLYCAGGRLRHRVIASRDSTDLMPCPLPGWMEFDDQFVYWVEGNSGRVLRRTDGQRIVLRSLARGTHGFATTPQGHLFVTDAAVLPLLRLRGAGPILDASLEEVGEDRLRPTLIADFLSGRAL